MRKYNNNLKGNLIRVNTSYQAQSIEQKMKSILTSKEPIDASAPIIYTDRKDGTKPQYDIRTDRFDIAVEMMDKHNSNLIAKRMEVIKGGADTAVNTSDIKKI